MNAYTVLSNAQPVSSSANNTQTVSGFRLKDPASAITHFIGMISAMAAAPFLFGKAAGHTDPAYMISGVLFIVSMILLYGASTFYHAIIANERVTLLLKKLDHIMIYFLIAGSYAPVCLLALPDQQGVLLCSIVWILACAGLILTIIWVNSPKWLNSSIYIAMGWLCIFAIRDIYANLSQEGFFWLFLGGVIYTIGGVIYALKLPLFNSLHKGFGSHEIFHLFVMAGSLCHFIMVYRCLF